MLRLFSFSIRISPKRSPPAFSLATLAPPRMPEKLRGLLFPPEHPLISLFVFLMPRPTGGTIYSPCAPAFHRKTISALPSSASFSSHLIILEALYPQFPSLSFPLSFRKPAVLRFKIITVFNLARASLIKLLSIIFYLVHLSTSPAPSLILPFPPQRQAGYEILHFHLANNHFEFLNAIKLDHTGHWTGVVEL